ncbi:hypothetical protein FHW67_001513 [Herbaspirillum sp. Sphag1AN]|uniref:HutD/Ves family protein n=1 Tax=unclassified Herbaspirillum TaxID=2624150 RepID=UPI00160E2F75|nr:MULTISPECIES: HutD family protein [unclassified Herbaspirillum]MBB3212233.1 hypothetical protein [Herbaspirillum sp. Sphag1AN]MBB3245669.1 hypothetical protein [Herbaspirillum sp. Sphag64]
MALLIPQSRQRLMRWKNGGGMTCELMRVPEDSSLETFDWRVSVATVQQGGSFSAFTGVDRSLAILEGKGLWLRLQSDDVDAGRTQSLTPRDPVLRFPGEINVESTLIDGGIVDFNVMTRRSRFDHTLERISLNGRTSLTLATPSPGDMIMLYVVNGSCLILAEQQRLHQGEAILFDQEDSGCRLEAVAAELMVVRLFAVNSSTLA